MSTSLHSQQMITNTTVGSPLSLCASGAMALRTCYQNLDIETIAMNFRSKQIMSEVRKGQFNQNNTNPMSVGIVLSNVEILEPTLNSRSFDWIDPRLRWLRGSTPIRG